MFHHVKELQFNARVSAPDPRFARLLLEQFGGGNGELKAAIQYFIQAFGFRKTYPDKYDMLMDIATEELAHLEIVGAMITMLLEGINGELKDAADSSAFGLFSGNKNKDKFIQEALVNPHFYLQSSGGPMLTDSQGVPWTGAYINANGDLTVDLRSDLAAESRAKITYENLIQFTDDPYVKESLGFLMTREIAHYKMFAAALETIEPNFPPGVLQGDPRYTHLYFNMSDGGNIRGPWNEGQGSWEPGENWVYVENPQEKVVETNGLLDQPVEGTKRTQEEAVKVTEQLSQIRSHEVTSAMGAEGEVKQWSDYPDKTAESPIVAREKSKLKTPKL
ncbi:manganese catalase family protein [Ancylothrix sp. C2]|uniref:manganese catalase family protein n=1 Tax=Ancylothrix sp. D3o TaxID=2953691 RepID=UPI0021BB7708|nr:manganese catalase family protein [Ancylothrix sp. D3o]MCT7950423.1 manganese catalase family protein [Ancylothrix sp. D3o]